jgi:transglutaminase-like putative cysteine protease
VKYLIERQSSLRFDQPVREHHVQLRVAPWDDASQRLTACALTVEPAAEPACHRDGFGNQVHRFCVMAPHEGLTTRLRAEVETLIADPFDYPPVAPARERDWLAHSLQEAPRLWDFVLHRSPLTPPLADSLDEEDAFPVYDPETSLLAQAQAAMTWIGERFACDPLSEDGLPDLATLLEGRTGSAADLSHLLVALVRGWGVPARYALGYIDPAYFEPDADEKGEDAEPAPQTMHVWSEILIPGAGWRGLDPSQGLLADATYVRVAVGRDAADVRTERAAYKGDGGEPQQLITLSVTRLD